MMKYILILCTFLAFVIRTPAGHAKSQAETNIKKITKAPITDASGDEVMTELGPSELKAAPAEASAPADPSTSVSGRAPSNAPPAAPSPAVKPKEEAKAEPPAKDKPRPEVKSVPAETVLRWLTNGNVRFTTRSFRKDGRGANDRKRLFASQRPHAIVLSCSDSRTPPELIFDQALGEIVTVRVAGPALDAAVIATIEEALEDLDPHLLVVMGHDKCSTIDSALKVKDGSDVGSASIAQILSDIRPRLKTISPEKPSPHLEVESAVNADGVGRELLKRSEIVRKKVEAGDLVIKPALYHLESGKVTFY